MPASLQYRFGTERDQNHSESDVAAEVDRITSAFGDEPIDLTADMLKVAAKRLARGECLHGLFATSMRIC